MHSLPTLAATTVETFWNAMPHLLGMLMVMLTLAVLWGLCELTAVLVQRFLPAAAAAAPTATAPAAAHPATRQADGSAEVSGAIPPDVVAVIAAAVNTVLGAEHKVISIKSQDSSWEKAGRQSVLTSHKIR